MVNILVGLTILALILNFLNVLVGKEYVERFRWMIIDFWIAVDGLSVFEQVRWYLSTIYLRMRKLRNEALLIYLIGITFVLLSDYFAIYSVSTPELSTELNRLRNCAMVALYVVAHTQRLP
jgi:hypothetical protein